MRTEVHEERLVAVPAKRDDDLRVLGWIALAWCLAITLVGYLGAT